MRITDILVLLASAAAAYTDVTSRRIPNALPIALGIAGLASTLVADPRAVLAFAAILVAALAFGTMLHARGLLGGGDVKLIAAAAATYGLRDAPTFLAATLLAGGTLALAVAAIRGRLRATVANLTAFAVPMLAGVRPNAIVNGTKMPYALAIFAGALALALVHAMH
ncbi:MAG TPA: prepilin peptidase [Candidatus Baltobacteraceae bacterium]|nr:prepilin peptidase [Candidatus Baltobacteraceae bacterium]